MKLVKMSLAAAVLLSASAFALDNVKVSGDAKLFYSTSDKDSFTAGAAETAANRTGTNDLFDQGASAADTALRLGVTGDLLKGVSFGLTANAVSTLGLENNLVANTWTGAHTAVTTNGVDVKDAMWISELWLATTMGKTTAKVGRMELDTPLAFSESWSVAKNTFDAAVLINQDLPDTTLVGAWVGKGNGVNTLGNVVGSYDNSADVGIDAFLAKGAAFSTFMDDGAYAAAIVNNSFKPLTAQAWYYNVSNLADAYWLQADIDCQLVKGVKIGAQYANISPKDLLKSAAITTILGAEMKDSEAFAIKLGYEGIQNLKLSAAYSDVDNDGTLKIANVATDNLNAAQSKLYTEAWWNYGYVGAPGAESVNVTAEYNAGVAKLGAYYTDVTNDIATSTHEMTEVTLTATKSFGPLDATLAYVSTDADDLNAGAQFNTVQAYFTLNF